MPNALRAAPAPEVADARREMLAHMWCRICEGFNIDEAGCAECAKMLDAYARAVAEAARREALEEALAELQRLGMAGYPTWSRVLDEMEKRLLAALRARHTGEGAADAAGGER